jgi:hypothetical protein
MQAHGAGDTLELDGADLAARGADLAEGDLRPARGVNDLPAGQQ